MVEGVVGNGEHRRVGGGSCLLHTGLIFLRRESVQEWADWELNRDTWKKRKALRKGGATPTEQRLEWVVTSNVEHSKYKQLVTRTVNWETPTRGVKTHMWVFLSFFSSQIKVMSIHAGRGALERGVRNRAWVPLRTRSALWTAVFIPWVKCLFPAAPAAKHIYLWRKLFVPMETVLIVIRIFFVHS